MKHKHGSQAKQGLTLTKQIAKGTLASAILETSGNYMSRIVKSPVMVFGLGVVAGYFIYKYRKEIISSTQKAVDVSKDFILQQKENLEDIVAEANEE